MVRTLAAAGRNGFEHGAGAGGGIALCGCRCEGGALAEGSDDTQARATLPQAEDRPAEQPTDVTPMLESFRIGYSNLMEIWSLVLPPNSLLGLKRLSVTPAATFRMPDALWARIIFDFILAYRLRTLNRGHLLGALTPLYLAWVASHVQQATDAAAAERHIESVAAAFEADKPYLVSRWRWPDRFNP